MRELAAVGHGVDRVDHQVDEELLQLVVPCRAAARARAARAASRSGARAASRPGTPASRAARRRGRPARAPARCGRAMLSSVWMMWEMRSICSRIVCSRWRPRSSVTERLEQLGVALDHAHRRADLVREAGDDRGERGQLLGRARARRGLAAALVLDLPAPLELERALESSWFRNASRSSRRAMYDSIATDASSMSSFCSERSRARPRGCRAATARGSPAPAAACRASTRPGRSAARDRRARGSGRSRVAGAKYSSSRPGSASESRYSRCFTSSRSFTSGSASSARAARS